MATTTDRLQPTLLKKFHAKCAKAGISIEEKSTIIGAFGHDSSRDMSVQDLLKACDLLDAKINPQLAEIDLWRKRVMASIGGWLKVMSVTTNADKIKAIACRASAFENFNDIPRERLNNLYYAFLKKQKDFKRVEGIAKSELETLTYLN
jgi:hypothetical protein